MIRHPAIAWLSMLLVSAAAEAPDLLRFENGDQLHGTFQGFKDGTQAVWQRDDVSGEKVDFKTSNLRHIVLRGGQPAKSLTSVSHVALVNGDRVPGTIVAMDGSALTLATPYAGELRLPRDRVAMLAPSPLGGRLRYYGPFSSDDWKMSHPSFPDGMPDPPANADSKGDEPGRWQFSGSAWYWQGKHYGTALYCENLMPERAILKFDIAWKNRLSLAIGFHADFAKPKQKGSGGENLAARRGLGPGDAGNLPLLFGNGYVLQIFPTFARLYRTTVDARGEPSVQSISINGSGIRLGESGHATLEIRSNRHTGEITIFVNGEFISHWSGGDGGDPEGDEIQSPKGGGFGFLVQSEESPIKLSEIMMAEWNGMPDAARSLQVEDQDIVLLANGTDRFAGKVAGVADERISFESRFGKFQFPLDEVAEVRFARDGLAKASEPPADNLTIRLRPFGQISGRPLSGSATALRLLSPVFGEIPFKLESAVMLDFKSSDNFIDDWNAEF